MSKKLLIVKCEVDEKSKNLNNLQETLVKQLESGVVLLPKHCSLIYVSESEDVKSFGFGVDYDKHE